ncbi:hypothetical protein PR048_002796 [Dryococelus australis]|uniref:Uncharacterized protein n=1 Tax=Dryococelus australis TaxID=614101 RepID=A0ABQ9IL59_9NEOP|nr:hypothetical protein PR048_002796 [Dryococelus australis]
MATSGRYACAVCQGTHTICKCPAFFRKIIRRKARGNSINFNCLYSHHVKKKCMHCHRNHVTHSSIARHLQLVYKSKPPRQCCRPR